jgi:hypothetical protein
MCQVCRIHFSDAWWVGGLGLAADLVLMRLGALCGIARKQWPCLTVLASSWPPSVLLSVPGVSYISDARLGIIGARVLLRANEAPCLSIL